MYIYIHIILKKDDIYSNISYEFEKSPSVKVDQLQSVKRKKKKNILKWRSGTTLKMFCDLCSNLTVLGDGAGFPLPRRTHGQISHVVLQKDAYPRVPGVTLLSCRLKKTWIRVFESKS